MGNGVTGGAVAELAAGGAPALHPVGPAGAGLPTAPAAAVEEEHPGMPLLPAALTEHHRPARLQYTAPTAEGGQEVSLETEPSAGGVARGAAPGGQKPGLRAAKSAGGEARARHRAPASNPQQAVGSGPARNAPCPCGSGRKYKRCHGAPGASAAG
jgi:preprotein translocase subunit SecA